AAVERREPAVLVTVIDTRRSVPRRAGSKMLVYGDGRSSGTIGGGEMEARVVAAAADALATGRTSRLHYSLLDPSAGDPGVCGGEVELYLEPYMPRTTVYVVGAGHVGRAVIELADWLGYRVVAWDDRSEVLEETGGGLADGVTTVTGPIADAVVAEPIDAHTRVVMVTRNAALDVELLPVLLASPATYIGLMGSDRRWATTRRKLLEAGVEEADLARVHAPIGVEISAETPAEIAVSILAEVISHERSG
ncbi:MAG: XdhC/CoxI family protein, partial [Acidimicrobiia bacterium]|nr:XdhC/CoxI family protein [Acidimicrobiia bacterium]